MNDTAGPSSRLTVPVLFVVFNRPETTAEVFAKIRDARPERLYVAADGPRPNRPEDNELCEETRRIVTAVDWPCQVKTLFRKQNLGCKVAVSEGIDWFFENEEMGIIVEDDCLPNATFFRFCAELLQRYRNDERVMHISGDNFQAGNFRGDASYFFSQYPHIWGWATWRRAWSHYDREMTCWPAFKNSLRQGIVGTGRRQVYRFWVDYLDPIWKGKIDTWDTQWAYSCWQNSGLSIIPQRNLVSNIGFRHDATRTKKIDTQFSNLAVSDIEFPLVHPRFVAVDPAAERYTEDRVFRIPKRIDPVYSAKRAAKRVLGRL